MTETKWLDTFASNLTYYLNQSGMTQRDLAMHTGLSEGTICNYIRKRQFPSVKAIINIANAFGVSVDDLGDFDELIT